MKQKRVIIAGAGGRDFHDFLVYYRDNQEYKVVCFTAAQIPGIEKRIFPAKLSGKRYPKGIKIYSEQKLPQLIKKFKVDEVVLAYSDLSYKQVKAKEKIVKKSGAKFVLLDPELTMIKSKKPLIAVTAVRTGCGKSQTSRKVAGILKKAKKKVAVIRHPMPYGNLAKQIIQEYKTYQDLKKYKCTIEEREEYEPHLKAGNMLFAGVDYEKILRAAEKKADIILWDGGNNDTPFYKPDLWITVTDPHRAGHELTYYPGKINFEKADVIIINKVDTASSKGINKIKKNAKAHNHRAAIIEAASPITVDKPELLKGKKALVVEDGPTTTHGGMGFGAGTVAANKFKAKIIDPKPYAVGSIKEALRKYPYLKILPAIGYGKQQIKELRETINKTKADVVIDGTPVNLGRLIRINKPIAMVTYELKVVGRVKLTDVIKKFLAKRKKSKNRK